MQVFGRLIPCLCGSPGRQVAHARPVKRWRGVLWMRIVRAIEQNLHAESHHQNNLAYRNVRRFLNETSGEGNWDTERRSPLP